MIISLHIAITKRKMGSIDVFDWTLVELSENFTRRLPKENKIESIQLILETCNADDSGVSILLEQDNEKITVQGSWENVLKSNVKLMEFYSTIIESAEQSMDDAIIHSKVLFEDIAGRNDILNESFPFSDETFELETHNSSLEQLTENSLQLVDHTIEIEDSPFDEVPLSMDQPLPNVCQLSCNIDSESGKELSTVQLSDSESPMDLHSCEQELKDPDSLDEETYKNLSSNIPKIDDNSSGSMCDDDREVYVTIALDSLNDDTKPNVSEKLGREDSLDLVDIKDDTVNCSKVADNSDFWKVNSREIFDETDLMVKETQQLESEENNHPLTGTKTVPGHFNEDDDHSEREESSTSTRKVSKREIVVDIISKHSHFSRCGTRSSSKNQDLIHQNESDTFKFSCNRCSYKTNFQGRFANHEKFHEKNFRIHQCSKCDFSTENISTLREHKKRHTTPFLKCDLCNFSTRKEKSMMKHKLKHQPLRDREFRCSQCDFTASKDYQLRKHSQEHKSGESLKCPQCSYTVWSKQFLKRHVRNVHLNLRSYLCQTCGKWFKRSDALKQHSLLHQTERPTFSCPVCQKEFWSKQYVIKHMEMHSEFPSSLCNTCGASFKSREALRRHEMTIHENPGSFNCSDCGRKFNTKFTLLRHIKQHSLQVAVKQPSAKIPKPQLSLLTVQGDDYTGVVTSLRNQEKVPSPNSELPSGEPLSNTAMLMEGSMSDGHMTVLTEVDNIYQVSQGEVATALMYLT